MGNGTATKEHVNEVMDKDVASKTKIVDPVDVKKQFDSRESLKYIKNDTYIANPSALLGRVFYEVKGDNTLIPFILPIKGIVNPDSVLKSPQTRVEMILDSKAAGSIGIASYLSLTISDSEVFEFRVIDNSAARIIDTGDDWEIAVEKWMASRVASTIIQNPDVERIGVVTGMVQKYISTKKFRKFETNVKGGAFGVNVGGELYTSSSEYALDIVYGLDLVYLPRTMTKVEMQKILSTGDKVKDPAAISILDNKFMAAVQLNNGFLPTTKSSAFISKVKRYSIQSAKLSE
jgi:hypothetical protein